MLFWLHANTWTFLKKVPMFKDSFVENETTHYSGTSLYVLICEYLALGRQWDVNLVLMCEYPCPGKALRCEPWESRNSRFWHCLLSVYMISKLLFWHVKLFCFSWWCFWLCWLLYRDLLEQTDARKCSHMIFHSRLSSFQKVWDPKCIRWSESPERLRPWVFAAAQILII